MTLAYRTRTGWTACQIHVHSRPVDTWPCRHCATARAETAAAVSRSPWAPGHKRSRKYHKGLDGAAPDRRGKVARMRLGKAGKATNSAHPARRAAAR